MIKQEDVYRIGRLGKPHGVKGEVTFQIDDDIFDRVDADYLILEMDGILVPFFIEEYRFKTDSVVLLKLLDIDSEERARELTGTAVYFPREQADQDADNLSWAEIIGYAVLDAETGGYVGAIEEVDDTTINTLFGVTTPTGDAVLIPANEETIVGVDKEKRTISIEIPDGLLDL